ncbi:MAG: FkbM family methyltransferase [Planctomycetota bacterium]|nr:FkbM family methyltransferase [Planctomycetota bacterium]
MSSRSIAREAFRILRSQFFSDKAKALKERRRALFRLLEGQAEVITFVRDGVRWTVNLADRGVARRTFVHGDWQAEEIRSLTAWLKAHGYLEAPRTHALDIGANIGSPSLSLARVTGMQVWSIEPAPENFALLERNVKDNGLHERIRCFNLALTASRRTVALSLHESRSGGHKIGVSEGGLTERFKDSVPVQGMPLDELMAEHGLEPARVAFVWSDCQAGEPDVVATGTRLWAAGAPLYAEVWPKGLEARGDLDGFIGLLRKHFKSMIWGAELEARGARAQAISLDRLDAEIRVIKSGHEDALFLP